MVEYNAEGSSKRTQVQESMEYLADRLLLLQGRLDELRKKLDPILSDGRVETSDVSDRPMPVKCKHSVAIRNFGGNVNKGCEVLANILDRIEI